VYLDVDAVLRAVSEGEPGVELIKRVGEALGEVEQLTSRLGQMRRDEIESLLASGMSQNEIGRRVGLTSARISQLRKSGTPPAERAFFGSTSTVIAAVAEKLEAGKTAPGPVVSVDDVQAYERLRDLVVGLGLDATYETVKPPGEVWLNRDGLVVICGPRHSALIRQVLEADRVLVFEHDRRGWYLTDRSTMRVYRSPEDDGEPGDVAYLGRLPRPDGQGTFVYIAGIHAAGSAGVVHWLGRELPALYRDVKTRRFSTLIRCEYSPTTREVVSSERITPIYRHEG